MTDIGVNYKILVYFQNCVDLNFVCKFYTVNFSLPYFDFCDVSLARLLLVLLYLAKKNTDMHLLVHANFVQNSFGRNCQNC